MKNDLQISEVRTEVTSDELKENIDTIEETYEFFLAYAAQGVSGSGTGISGELTGYLAPGRPGPRRLRRWDRRRSRG